jgi:hypothetical protein
VDKLDLIIKSLDDLRDETRSGFSMMNGRVRKAEGDIIRIKTVWTAITVAVAAVFHYLFG